MSQTPRNQIRLHAITGSIADISSQGSELSAIAASSIDADNLHDIMKHTAAAIKRIHGADSFTEAQAGVFTHNESKFIGILSASSDLKAGGSLTIRSTSALSGAVEMKSTLDVDGLATLAQATVEDLNVAGGVVFTDASGRLDNDPKFTWDGNKLSIDGALDLTGGIVGSSLSPGQIVYVGADGALTTESALNYNASSDTLGISGSISVAGNLTGSTAQFSGDVAVNGGDITTTATGAATIFNANATTVNIAGGATSGVNIGNAASDVTLAGDLRINGNEIKSSTGAVAIQFTGSNVTVSGSGFVSGTLQVVGNLTGSTAEFSGQLRAATARIDSLSQPGVVIAGADGLLTTTASLFYSNNRLEVSSSVRVSGDIAVNGEGGVADITSTASTAAIFDAGVNTIYLGNDAELIQMGEVGGLVDFAGDVRLTGSIDIAGTSAEYISKINGGALQLRAGDLSSGVGKVKVTLSGSDLRFDDGYRAGWDNDIKLAGSQNDWDRFKNIFGEASILQAISNAAALPTDAKFMYKVTNSISAPAVITGSFIRQVDGTHFSGSYAAVPTGSRNENVDVFLNGQLLVSKSYDAVNYDYDVAGDGTSITFNFGLETDDFISILVPVTVASVADYVQASGAGGGGGGGGGGASALDDLTDVTITSPTNGQVLKYNGTAWVNDADAGGAAAGSLSIIEFDVGTTTASSSTSIPANAKLVSVSLRIGTAYSSAATLSVGTASSASLLLATSDVLPQTTGIYQYELFGVNWSSSAPVRVTVSGSPAAGAATCRVIYASSVNN